MPGDLVIFDFDGTLADSVGDIATGLNRALAEAGVQPAPTAQVRAWVGHGVRRLIGQAIGSEDPSRVEPLTARFRIHYAECCLDTTALYDGMRAALAAVGARHTLAVLSNKPQAFLDRIVTGLDIAPLFAVVVGGDALPVAKPDPDTIAHVVARAGAAGRVWMVGDSAVDVETGRRFGARTVGCAWGLRGTDALRAAGADVIVEHPSALPAVLG